MHDYISLAVLGLAVTGGLLLFVKRKAIDHAVVNYVGSLAAFAGDVAAENFHAKLEELADEVEEEMLLQEDLQAVKVKGEVN